MNNLNVKKEVFESSKETKQLQKLRYSIISNNAYLHLSDSLQNFVLDGHL